MVWLFGDVYDFFLTILVFFNLDSADFFKKLIDPKKKVFSKLSLKRANSDQLRLTELPTIPEEKDKLLIACVLQDQFYKLFEKNGGYLLVEAPVVDNIDDVDLFDKIYESRGYELITVCRGPGAISVFKNGKWELSSDFLR